VREFDQTTPFTILKTMSGQHHELLIGEISSKAARTLPLQYREALLPIPLAAPDNPNGGPEHALEG
jgi:hypothetical protein